MVQNLGIVLAESGRKVLLVDADFRRPHLHRKFGLANEWGLIDPNTRWKDWQFRPDFRASQSYRIASHKIMSQRRFIHPDFERSWRISAGSTT